MISIIVAVGKNNEIGKGNQLLWHLSADMKHFKETTTSHTVIMGRKTFESIGKPLPNRQNIVITRNPSYTKEGVLVANSLEEAIAMSEKANQGKIFIIGGAEIYKHALPLAQKIYITRIEKDFPEADAFFPDLDENIWQETSCIKNNIDKKNPFPYAFLTFEKQTK